MTTVYELESGQRIGIFYYEDFEKWPCIRRSASVTPMARDSFKYEGDETEHTILHDYKGNYINYQREKVYLTQYKADDVTLMASRIAEAVKANDRWMVMDDEIWATFQKYADDVVLIAPMRKYETLIPMMGIGLCSDKTRAVACVLDETRYTKDQWSYKIGFRPNDFKDRAVCAREDMYFCDFCSFLKAGKIVLLSKTQYFNYILNGGDTSEKALGMLLESTKVPV
jgi:hypothetical protein